jgi:tRNA A-37 threonylcarbamoyl transferase component Bud32
MTGASVSVEKGTSPAYIGSYQTIRLLGSGAFGEVYQAYQPFLDRQVAIKILHSDLIANEVVKGQSANEAKAVARLRHPNIVSVFEFGVLPAAPDPFTYIVMEYLPGETLQARLAKTKISVPDVVSIAEQLADGLDYAHSHHVVHRDLKPANILFTERDQPVIVDFGLAKLTELGRAPGEIGSAPAISEGTTATGTPAYMSPEQVTSTPTSPKSDQYSLALIVYEMLTGRRPFADASLAYEIQKRLKELPPSVRDGHPEFSEAVNAVFWRALAVNPDDRYSTVSDFAHELGDALIPDRRRARVQVVSDPVQAALLKASRRTILYGLWGIIAVTAQVVLFAVSLFLRSYRASASFFVWDGLLLAKQADQTYLVTGFWPGSVAQAAGVQIGDVTTFDLSSDYGNVNADIQVNGQPRSALPPSWTPVVTDTLERHVIRNGQTLTISYPLALSTFKLALLAAALVPLAFSFLAMILLLRRWGAEPGLQLFTIFSLAGSMALLGVALADIAYGLIAVALYILLPTFICFILVFPEPTRAVERHPRRLLLLYAALPFGLVQFLLGSPLVIGGFEANLVLYIIYAVALTAAIILKWGRRDIRRYSGLWGIVAIIIASNIAAVAATFLFGLDGQTIVRVFGNGLNHMLVAYGCIFVSVLIGVILAPVGYHLVQRQLGVSLVTTDSQSSSARLGA